METKKSKEQEKVEEMVCVSSPDKEEVVCAPGKGVTKVEAKEPIETTEKRSGNIIIGTLNFFVSPYRGLKESYEKRYSEAKRLFILDFILLGVVGLLVGLNIYLFISRTNGFEVRFLGNSPLITNGNIPPPLVVPSEFLTKIKINGQDKLIVDPGEELEYAVSYQNKGGQEIYDVALKINLEAAILDFNRLEPGKGVLRKGALVWTKDQISEFSKLPAGAAGELKFKIGTARVVEPARVLKFGSVLKSWAEVSYKLENNFSEAVSEAGKVREDNINSDLEALVLARYFTPEGDQLGRGPLPPRVGEATKYWIFWSIDNNLNDVSDVSVSAVLPPNVQWTGNKSVSLGDLNYNSDRRTVFWKAGEARRYTGEDWPKQGVAFEIALTPNMEQVGREALLLGQIKIFGSDKFTGRFLEKTAPDITTNLIYDNLAMGKEKVMK